MNEAPDPGMVEAQVAAEAAEGPEKFTESAHQYSREFTRQYLDQNVAEGIDPFAYRKPRFEDIMAPNPPGDSKDQGYHAGLLAEAAARDENMSEAAKGVRAYLESVARQNPYITDKGLVTLIARVYISKRLRKPFRLGGSKTDIPWKGSAR